jgi:DNA-directed RNA polymerase subunit alpha
VYWFADEEMEAFITQYRKPLLDQEIESLELTVRAMTACRIRGIKTIGELVAHSEDEIGRWKNIGPSTVHDMREGLARYGLRLRGDLYDATGEMPRV